jgi:hypothetical protein
VSPGIAPLERRAEHVEIRLERRLDRDRAEVDAEVLGEQLGIGLRVVARVPGRHRHPVDVLGSERVDGEAGDDRGVDAARQPDHHVAEPFFEQ